MKIYKHFSQHTVRVTRLKGICVEAEIEYEILLGYGKTRFLAFRKSVDRIVSQYVALESYFLDPQKKSSPPFSRRFFKCPVPKILLIFIRDQCDIFECSIKKIEGDSIAGFEALEIMSQLQTVVEARAEDKFFSLAFREEMDVIKRKLPFHTMIVDKNGDDIRVVINEKYLDDLTEKFFSDCINYFKKWIEPLKPLGIWSWVSLKNIPEWKDIEPCMDTMNEKNLLDKSHDVKIHTEFCNAKLIIQNSIAKWNSDKQSQNTDG